MKRSPVYFITNWTFFLILVLLFSYAYYFYPNNQPVKCLVFQTTGQPCKSCGLSRSLSAMTHGDIDAARNHNEQGVFVFYFFLTQLLIRLSLIIYLQLHAFRIRKPWIILDIIFAVVSFLFVFYPFLGA